MLCDGNQDNHPAQRIEAKTTHFLLSLESDNDDVRDILAKIIKRIDLKPGEIKIELDPQALAHSLEVQAGGTRAKAFSFNGKCYF